MSRFALVFLLVVAGCSDQPVALGGSPDAYVDTGFDAGIDESWEDAGDDSIIDPMLEDAGVTEEDAGTVEDAGDPSPVDAGVDPVPDASVPDPEVDAGGGDEQCNSSNCGGCCVGTTCVAGDSEEACGYGGMACSPCGAGQVCGMGCELDHGADYEIVVYEIVVDSQWPEDSAYPNRIWDAPIGNLLPDPYPWVCINGAAETEYNNCFAELGPRWNTTDAIYSPGEPFFVFPYYLLDEGVVFTFQIHDATDPGMSVEDPDITRGCMVDATVIADAVRSGTRQTLTCPSGSSGLPGYVMSYEVRLVQ